MAKEKMRRAGDQVCVRNLLNAQNQFGGAKVLDQITTGRDVGGVGNRAHAARLHPNAPIGVAVHELAALRRIQHGTLIRRGFALAE